MTAKGTAAEGLRGPPAVTELRSAGLRMQVSCSPPRGPLPFEDVPISNCQHRVLLMLALILCALNELILLLNNTEIVVRKVGVKLPSPRSHYC